MTPEAKADVEAMLAAYLGKPETEAMHQQWLDLAACGDCVVWIANADDSGIEDAEDHHARFATRTDWIATLAPCSDDDNDGWFSRHDCDTCGAIAGQRYIVHATAH